jgi:hypothetical protein
MSLKLKKPHTYYLKLINYILITNLQGLKKFVQTNRVFLKS